MIDAKKEGIELLSMVVGEAMIAATSKLEAVKCFGDITKIINEGKLLKKNDIRYVETAIVKVRIYDFVFKYVIILKNTIAKATIILEP